MFIRKSKAVQAMLVEGSAGFVLYEQRKIKVLKSIKQLRKGIDKLNRRVAAMMIKHGELENTVLLLRIRIVRIQYQISRIKYRIRILRMNNPNSPQLKVLQTKLKTLNLKVDKYKVKLAKEKNVQKKTNMSKMKKEMKPTIKTRSAKILRSKLKRIQNEKAIVIKKIEKLKKNTTKPTKKSNKKNKNDDVANAKLN